MPVVVSNVTPAGRVPVTEKVGAGKPLAVTVKVPAVPATNVVVAALVMAGASFTVNVNACVLSGPTPFDAVNVSGCMPPVPAAGVPLRVPVPLPLVNVTPAGNVPPVS